MKKITLGSKLRYFFDNTMSKGTPALITWLAILSGIMIVLTATIVTIVQIFPEGTDKLSFPEAIWQSLMRTLDSGTVAGDNGWNYRLISIIITIFGIFIVSTLISILSAGLESKLDELRKGRSFVVEKNHTLILGWSSKIFTIISELLVANESQKKPRIVILSEKDKVEMEDEIRSAIPNFKNTKIICRSGNPNKLNDLSIVNPHEAKSIIMLAPEEGSSDSFIIKNILAITNNPNRRKEPYHIVSEIKDEKNLEVARMVGKDEVELILTDDVISRIMVQTSRQSGLSVVYTELMDFDGAEIYFNEEKLLYGKTFGESLFEYKDCTVIGIQFNNGTVKMNPPMDYIIQPGDKIIAIAEDDSTLIIKKDAKININTSAITDLPLPEQEIERILILGWNQRAFTILREMDNYVRPGSIIKVVASYIEDSEAIIEAAKKLKNITFELVKADTTSREVIDNLDVTSYNHVQLLCYKEQLDMQEADAQTLIALLHLRRISEETGKDMNIVSEMLDQKNRDLAEVTKADDFIVSDKLISLLMTQVSENKHLMRVFEDLFDADGSEIYLKPITSYIKTGEPVSLYTLVESARLKGQIAIGYRIAEHAFNSEKAYGVVVSPDKSKVITFKPEDKIIVIAED